MMKETITGIAQALCKAFGEESPIYTKNVEQDLNAPCFIIRCLNPSQSLVMGTRYEFIQPFDVHYFIASSDDITEVIEKLYDCLEYILVGGDLVRGTGMHAESVDGVLHFFVDYNMFVLKKKVGEIKMENLETQVMERMGKCQ